MTRLEDIMQVLMHALEGLGLILGACAYAGKHSTVVQIKGFMHAQKFG